MGKKDKDPNKPKRAMAAYMFFSQAIRPTVKKENPDMSFGELGKEIARRWKLLGDGDKEPYEQQAAEDKKRYEKEMVGYKPPAGAAAPKAKKAAKKKKAEEDDDDEDDDGGDDE